MPWNPPRDHRRRGERLTWSGPEKAPSPQRAPIVRQSDNAHVERFTDGGISAESTPEGSVVVARRSNPPACTRRWEQEWCGERGDHLCEPRVTHIVGFFAECLTHTKGRWAGQPFLLHPWQYNDIIRPLFGTVTWDDESQSYVRRYRVAWIELARKNGKSELLAGIALYLLCADGEGGAELYGCARDRDQARKVFDVAERMVKMSSVLSKRLKIYTAAKRIIDEKTGSWYEIIAADALGNLGHNPHGIVFDEIISQPNGDLWNAMRTAMGARSQPLMVAATTAGDDPHSFAASEHAEMERIRDDPARAPHVFVCMRNTPKDADPWDEAIWKHANPGLDSFLSRQALRDEALEARNDPTKQNAFQQFRLNQWVSQANRWMPLHLWDASSGNVWSDPERGRNALRGRECFAGFDLSAKFDLTSWCLAFAPAGDDGIVHLLWRFWVPEEGLKVLDKANDRKFSLWRDQGWLTVTEGNVIDYDRVIADIAQDAALFAIRGADCDEWSMWPIIAKVAETCGLDAEHGELAAYKNTYERMSPGMDDVFGLVKDKRLAHHGNPVARFCFDAVTVRRASHDPNLIRPIKPERGGKGKRIDAVPTAAMALNAMRGHVAGAMRASSYEDAGLMVI